jgi:hypothetical protein
MRYEDAKRILDQKVESMRRHLKAACESEDAEVQTAQLKRYRVIAGQLYTEAGNDLKAIKAGNDVISAREARQAESTRKQAAREAKKAASEATTTESVA